ncbi:MAG: hypothetical protein HKN16_00010, partial [Saprospiraceae bacterium]|nr:hypothetical protein [Saprospiraceae bacterium]
DDNGYFLSGYGIVSRAITLSDNGEPTSEDGDNNTNLTLDLGVIDCITPPRVVGTPSDTTVECHQIPSPPIIGSEIFGTSYCYSVSLSFAEDTTGVSCDNGYTLTRIWTATDSIGQIARDTQEILVQDMTGPQINGVPVDTLVECDSIPDPVLPTITDNCDTAIASGFVEITIQHPIPGWKNSPGCEILFGISQATWDEKGTPGDTSDDEISFLLAVIGKNSSGGWNANIAGIPFSGNYFQSYSIGPVLSGGPNLTFDIIDQSDPTCLKTVTLDLSGI